MTLDELDIAWRATNEAVATKEQREQLIAATRRGVKRLWGQIFHRDVTETIAAVFVMIFFGRYCFDGNYVVGISAVGLVFWALSVIYRMHRTRTIQRPASLDAPVREFCRIELDRLRRQIQLQGSVLWWYIAPCVVYVNAFFIGRTGFGIASVVYGMFTLLLAWGIYARNMRAVARGLVPARDELASLLSQLDDAPASPLSLTIPESVERFRRDTVALAAARPAPRKLAIFWDIMLGFPVDPALYKPDVRKMFKAIFLAIVGIWLTALTIVALASGQFDSGYLIYFIVTLLLGWGIYRIKSAALGSVMLLLAALAFVALTGGLFHSSYDGTAKSDGPSGDWLAGVIADLRKENKLVGLGAMVMVDGRVMATAAHGERKIRSGVPIELGDRWHLGSITKSITATMIARLVESGQMKWTDTIGQRFPDAAIHQDWRPVTLQQLLTHTAGAPANFSHWVSLKQPELGPECTKERRKAVIDAMAEKPAHPPGESFAYSNVGYTIAGVMAESATGVSWEDLVKREVFEPSKLSDAGFGPPKSPSKTLTQPRGHTVLYGWKISASDDDDNTPIMGPAGAVNMTLRDLCTYATEHLRGELGSGKFLAADTYKRLHTPTLHNYAFGWVVNQPTNEIPHMVYWHNGSNTMWYALVVFIPGKNMVVAVTSNDGDITRAEAAAWKVVKAAANKFNVEGDAARRKSLPPED